MKTKRLFAVLACVLLVMTLLVFVLPTNVKGWTGSGGPDAFGYTYKNSNTSGGPTYDWIEISGTGTEVLPASDDAVSSATALGFFFNFYGTDYSSIAIANNGLIFAVGTTYQFLNDPITQSPGVHGFLAPFWDDLVTWGSAGAIYYQTLGTAPDRMFVVEWLDNQHYHDSTSGVTFEAIMYEGSNNIKFQYQDVDFGNVSGSTSSDLPPYNNGGSATVGIESPTGDVGLQYSYNEEALTSGLAILFKFPQFAGTNLVLSKQAPAQKDWGSTMTYSIHYQNFGNISAQNVILVDTLPSEVEFVSASDGGTYDPGTGNVTWNIGNVAALGHDYVTVDVRVKSSVPVGTIIQNNASIRTSALEVRYDDNQANVQTTVTGPGLPAGVGVEPNFGGYIPSIYWNEPVTFSYDSCAEATGVNINIHIEDGGPDISGPMIGGPPHWTYTVTFYPRHGEATVTYTIFGPCAGNVTFNIYIDPAGYIYDTGTNERIAGASVWLQRPDGLGGWESVPTGALPPIMQPDVNPQITGADGQYQWDVLSGSYRVHVEASGYYEADSIVVSIPPPVTDLHVGLTSLPAGSTTAVTGITREVNGDILAGVSITLDSIGPVLGNQSGQYEITANATGNYTIVAHKDGFRDRSQTVNIAGLGPAYAVTCNFQGQYGLIPNAPDMWYALDCINRWLYPPNSDIGLDMWTALDVINAWLYPIQ